jgi:hypothetical protein
MREWVIENGIATADELNKLEEDARADVLQSRNNAWKEYLEPIKAQALKAVELMRSAMVNDMDVYNKLQSLSKQLEANREPLRRDVMKALAIAVHETKNYPGNKELVDYFAELRSLNSGLYNSYTYSDHPKSAVNVQAKAGSICRRLPGNE